MTERPQLIPRKPPAAPPVDPQAMAQFIATGEVTAPAATTWPMAPARTPAAETPSSPAPADPLVEALTGTHRVGARNDGRIMRRATIYLPLELHNRVVRRAKETNRDRSDVIAEALRKHFT